MWFEKLLTKNTLKMCKNGQNHEEKWPPLKGTSEPSEVDSGDKYFDKIKGFKNKRSIKRG